MAFVRKPTTKRTITARITQYMQKNFVLIPCTFRGVSNPFLTWKSIIGTF